MCMPSNSAMGTSIQCYFQLSLATATLQQPWGCPLSSPTPTSSSKSWQTLTLPKSHWAFCRLPCKTRISFPEHSNGSEPRLRLHSPSKSFAKKSTVSFFRDTSPFIGRHKTLLPARTGALSPNTQHSNNCPRDFQLPLSSHLIPTFCSKDVLGPPPPYQPKLKQSSRIPAPLKTEISDTTTISPRPLCSTIKSICGSHLLVFTQMRGTKTRGLHWLCLWKSHTSDNLSKLPLSTRRDTSATTHTPETKDPHPF